MLAAMTLNKTKTIKGGYIIGRFWNFVILEKLENILPNKKMMFVTNILFQRVLIVLITKIKKKFTHICKP